MTVPLLDEWGPHSMWFKDRYLHFKMTGERSINAVVKNKGEHKLVFKISSTH